jgi:tRNA(Arg) A34 adenosine deaminase TadA
LTGEAGPDQAEFFDHGVGGEAKPGRNGCAGILPGGHFPAMRADIVGDGNALLRAIDGQVLIEQRGGERPVAHFINQGDRMPEIGQHTPVRFLEGEMGGQPPAIRSGGRQGTGFELERRHPISVEHRMCQRESGGASLACGLLSLIVTAVSESFPSERDRAKIREIVAVTRGKLGTSHPSPFGSQIVATKTSRLLARRLNAVIPDNDPTGHAEVRVIRAACKKIGSPRLAGYTLYTTCEPCPMCLTACLWAGLDRVVYGTVVRRPDSPHPPLFSYSAKEFAAKSQLSCVVEGPVEEALCRVLVDDPVVQKYFAKLAKKHIHI